MTFVQRKGRHGQVAAHDDFQCSLNEQYNAASVEDQTDWKHIGDVAAAIAARVVAHAKARKS